MNKHTERNKSSMSEKLNAQKEVAKTVFVFTSSSSAKKIIIVINKNE